MSLSTSLESDSDLFFAPGPDPFPTPEVFKEGEAELDDKYKLISERYFGETEEKLKAAVAELREELERQGFVLPGYDHLYRKLLRGGSLDVETAVRVAKSFLRMRSTYPQYFADVIPLSLSDHVFQQKFLTVMPHRDKHGRRVMILHLGRWNPDVVTFEQGYCAFYKLAEVLALEPKTQVAGVTSILDGGGYGFKQFRALSLDKRRSVVNFMQEGFPLWFRTFHIVNAPMLINVAYNIIRPFLSERLKEHITFHNSLSGLHKHVSKDILPEELGGTEGPIETDNIRTAISKFEDYFEEARKVHEDNRDRC